MRVTVGISGTGGGFQKFCRGETDISDASRPISADRSRGLREGRHRVHRAAGRLRRPRHRRESRRTPGSTTITAAELKTLWEPEAQGKVTQWSQVRTGWPDREIHLFGAGVDSGTYDYFTEAIIGKAKAQPRRLHLERGRQRPGAGRRQRRARARLLPFAYYEENKDKLKLVPVDDGKADNGDGPIAAERSRRSRPAPTSRCRGRSSSTSRRRRSDRPEVQKFVEFYLDEGRHAGRAKSATSPLGDAAYELVARPLRGTQDRHRCSRGADITGRRDHRAAAGAENARSSVRRCATRAARMRHRARAVPLRGAVGADHGRHHRRAAVETVAFLREVPIVEFLTGTEWTPLFANQHFGVLPLVAGTLLVSAIAMVVALPLGLLSAIYLSEYAPTRRAARRQAGPRAPRRRADRRLRLLRADVRHAAPAAVRARPRRLQRAQPGHRDGAS